MHGNICVPVRIVHFLRGGITIIEVDLHSRKPIYEQLIENITMLVMTGTLKADEQVPSVRQLAVTLAINPNTVQKAFTELERRGVLYSIYGKGRFVNENLGFVKEEQKKAYYENLSTLLLKMKSCGIEKEEAISMVKEIYEKGIANSADSGGGGKAE